MGALFHNAPLVHQQNHIGMTNRAKPVGDEKDRAFAESRR